MEAVEVRVAKSSLSGIKGAKKEWKMLEKSSTSYLGPGDRGFKSRSPDQNRQFSVRKLAVLTFWKGFSLFIAVQILTYHSDPKSDLQYEISHSVNSSLYSDLHTECSIVKSNLPQRSNVVYPSDG